MKILFIDDEAYRTRLYRRRLESAGHEVVLCTTLDEALDVMKEPMEQPFHAAVVDLQMGRPTQMEDEDWVRFKQLPGLWFLAGWAPKFQDHKTNVGVLTNKDPDDFRVVLQEYVVGLRPSLRVGVFRKTNVSAANFVGELLTNLAEHAPGTIYEP